VTSRLCKPATVLGLLFGLLLVSVGGWATPTPFDPLGESMPQFSSAVSWWINWLIVVGVSSLVFAWNHVGARWVLGAYVANHAVAIATGQILGADMLTNGLVSVTHVVFWTPAVVMLLLSLRRMGLRTVGSASVASVYGAWHIVALATMVISLFFDYRDSFVFLFTSPAT
jgi:hypothetical protein